MSKEKSNTTNLNGTYELDVKLRTFECSRIIKMSGNDTLEDLHNMIQIAFEFDNDHLYEFSIGKGANKKTYACSMDIYNDNGLWADKAKLNNLELKKNSKFEYLFDFGDNWQFDIRVKNILDEEINNPQITDYYGEAPEQYPNYEESGFLVNVSQELKVKDILDEIEDESIDISYEVLFEKRDRGLITVADTEKKRERIAELVLTSPNLLLQFFEADVRNILPEFISEEGWVCHKNYCNLMKLYSFGFCKTDDRDDDWYNEREILVPLEIKETYEKEIKKLKKRLPVDEIAVLSERYLRICGVIELDSLYEIIHPMVRKKYKCHEFNWLVFCHLMFWGRYEVWDIENTEYLSLYDEVITKEILDERKKYENEEYPCLNKEELLNYKEYHGAKLEWHDYINFNTCIDYRNASGLTEEIPNLISAGVVKEESVINYYADWIKKAGGRKTKKAERIIQKMYEELPKAIYKGNFKRSETKMEYRQLSLFDDM